MISRKGFLLHAVEPLFTSAISMSVKILIWENFMHALVFAGLGFWFAATWHMSQIPIKKKKKTETKKKKKMARKDYIIYLEQ